MITVKVGLFNDTFPPAIDGVANAVKNYADVLYEAGHTPLVISPRYPHVVDRYPYEVYRYASLKLTGKMPYRVGNCFEPKALHELYSHNMDLFHVHCPFASAMLARELNVGARNKKVPMIFTYHTKFDLDIEKYLKLDPFIEVGNRFVMNNIEAFDEVWAVTDGAGKWLKNLGYKGDYIVMPNGTDFAKGRASKENRDRFKMFYGITDEKILLFVGRMMWYKNIKLMLDTVKLLTKTDQTFKMIFVGDGVDRAAIEAYAAEIGVTDHCIFTGAVHNREDLRTFYSIADLFFFPSTFDTSGLVVKEAAACSCPSLLIRNSCAAENNADDVSCVLADETAENCAKRILDVFCHEDFRLHLAENAAEKVYYSWHDSIEKAMTRYEVVLSDFHKPKKSHWFFKK